MEADRYQIVRSSDGSDTLMVKNTNMSFHSTKGALTESSLVFIDYALEFYIKKNCPDSIRIIEMGFGTGLNVLLTAIKAAAQKIKLHYTSIDLFPVEPELLAQLNYGEITSNGELYQSIISAEWGRKENISEYFTLEKIKSDFLYYHPLEKIDICYFDAFAPEDQPPLWTEAVFKKIHTYMNSGGVLTTYCSKSVVRKTLQEAGFKVEKLIGPPGKREVVRALATSGGLW